MNMISLDEWSLGANRSTRPANLVQLRALPSVDDLAYSAASAASSLGSSALESSTGLTPASLAILYAAGLLTSFSPCALSLLPLTVSYISGAAGEREDGAAFLPTLAFAGGLASVFVGFGLSASLVGGVFGTAGSGSVFGALLLASLSSGVSIAMGLQLLDIIRIPLPSFDIDVPSLGNNALEGVEGGTAAIAAEGVGDSIGSEICFDDEGNLAPATVTPTDESSAQTSSASSLLRTFLLGGSSALVASPCATPVLTSLLAFVASSRNPTIGAALLFFYTLGYSTPLLVIGATGGQALANAQATAKSGGDGSLPSKIGKLITPLTASILIWYGTNGFLEALIGDPSISGLQVLD